MRRLFACFSVFALLLAGGTVRAADSSSGGLMINQWVRLGDNGVLTGRVVASSGSRSVAPVTDSTVALLNNGGEPREAPTDSEGRFSIEGLEPGVYSLSARGEGTYACYAMHLIGADHAGASRYPDHLTVVAARIEAPTIRASAIRYLPARIEQASASLEGVQLEALADTVCDTTNLYIVQTDGGLRGQIRMAGAVGSELVGARSTNVFVFSDGSEVARTVTESDGRFRIGSLDPGQFTALAVGPGGMAVVAFELVTPDATASNTRPPSAAGDGTRFVVQGGTASPGDSLNVQVAPLPEGQPLGMGDEVAAMNDASAGGFVTPGGGRRLWRRRWRRWRWRFCRWRQPCGVGRDRCRGRSRGFGRRR